MLSSVTFDIASGDFAVDLDSSDSAMAVVANGMVEVSINGSPTGDTPFTGSRSQPETADTRSTCRACSRSISRTS